MAGSKRTSNRIGDRVILYGIALDAAVVIKEEKCVTKENIIENAKNVNTYSKTHGGFWTPKPQGLS